jgi:hypothetical protein
VGDPVCCFGSVARLNDGFCRAGCDQLKAFRAAAASKMFLLRNCAACAAPLALDAPTHCVRCNTRYCSDRCFRYHAHRGGHDENCEEIANGGGAEKYHADKKYKEAVAVAVAACAADAAGQTCYICHEGGSVDEGLVRMCACRGETGFAHLSCLVRLAESSLSSLYAQDEVVLRGGALQGPGRHA